MDVTISLEALARLIGKKAVELKSELFDGEGEEAKLKEGAQSLIDAAFAKKFAAIKDENHGRGLRKAMEVVEDWVKSKGFIPEDGIQGAELLEAWATTLQKSDGGEKGKKLTPEQMESDPVAQEWLTTKVKALKEAHDKKTGLLTEQLIQAQNKSLRDRVQREALAVLDASNWVSGDDEDMKKRRVDTIFRLLEYDHLKEDKSGNVVVVDESGNPRKDATFNAISFADYVKGINPFGVHQYDPDKKSPSPPPTPPGGQPPKIKIRDGKHYEELRRGIIAKEADPTKRQAALKELGEAWIAQRPA